MSEQTQFLTPDGLAELERELDHLRTVRRKEAADLLNQVKELGTTVNNAEYDEVKRDQSYIEGRIKELENLLKHAKIVDHNLQPKGTVGVGSHVVAMGSDGVEEHFAVVGHMEANPLEGKISNESPVGQALMGRKVGDKVQIKVPNGVITYTLTSVE